MKIKFLVSVSAILIASFLTNQILAQEEKSVISNSTSQNRISLDIKGMDIVDVAKMLASRAGINIVVGKNVTGKVTMFLKDVDVWDAFEIILLANGLAYEKKDNIINVMTQRDYELKYGEKFQEEKQMKVKQLKYAKASELAKSLNQIKTSIGKIVADEGSNTLVLIDVPKKIEEMQEFIRRTDLPVQTRVFEINYAQVDELSKKIEETVTKVVGSVKIDERTNKIAVTDFPEKLDEITQLIKAFDEKTPQVLIDAQIIEIKPSDKFEMGVDWDYWIRKHFRVTAALPIGTSNRLFLGTTTASPAKKGQYKAVLDILSTIGDTKILSSPRIMTLNNQEAKILVGTKDAYITSSTSQTGETAITSQTVNFVDVGIKLFVTPTINKDGFVTMNIKPEVSSAVRTDITSEGQITQVPIVTTSETETTVMIKDGVTIIIGGLKKDQKTETVKKIPLLGDIPLLGSLFKSVSSEISATELVILLTPHIISGESSFADFAEIEPTDGTVVTFDKGEIVKERIISVVDETPRETTGPGYYSLVFKKIRETASDNYPEQGKGKVKLSFIILKDGRLLSEPIVVESEDSALNDYAVRAIKLSSPFPEFPDSIGKESEDFQLSIVYN